MKIYLFALFVILVGCGKSTTDDGDAGNPTGQSTYPAICEITNALSVPVACIDYMQNLSSQNTVCTTTELANFRAEGSTGAAYVAITAAGASTSCALTYPATNLGVSCGVAGTSIVRYFYGYFSSVQIQSDCSARGGTLFPNEG